MPLDIKGRTRCPSTASPPSWQRIRPSSDQLRMPCCTRTRPCCASCRGAVRIRPSSDRSWTRGDDGGCRGAEDAKARHGPSTPPHHGEVSRGRAPWPGVGPLSLDWRMVQPLLDPAHWPVHPADNERDELTRSQAPPPHERLLATTAPAPAAWGGREVPTAGRESGRAGPVARARRAKPAPAGLGAGQCGCARMPCTR